MKIIFLDIDGVLNTYGAYGIHDPNSTKPECIERLNVILNETGAKIVIISSWKDQWGIKTTTDILYSREVKMDSIFGGTANGFSKEKGIQKFLSEYPISHFVIIDDNIELNDITLRLHHVQTHTFVGLTDNDVFDIIRMLN